MCVARKLSKEFLVGWRSEAPFLSVVVATNERVTESPLTTAQRLSAQATDALRGVADAGRRAERMSVLRLCETVVRQLDQVTVATVAGLDRDGAFVERGYRSATQALSDLLGWERFEARRRTVAAEQVVPRVGLDGSVLPARLPAMAEVFAAGRAGLRHVEVVTRLLGSPAAGRLSPEQWAGAEAQLAGWPAATPLASCTTGARAGRVAGSGRRRARRPAPGPGERAVRVPAARRRRQAEGPVRGRGDVRRDRRGARRARQAAHRRRRAQPPGSGRPRRWPMCAATSSTTATCRNPVGTARTSTW